ncbi:hypothetical protein IQ07DRAFT_41943 [Pyrenochaeta sp. DS3sAY3a]|nr:hypothetical protein IQ07DRAFT_41943 [Pyrenochaeta sp. DS3sAY3a]
MVRAFLEPLIRPLPSVATKNGKPLQPRPLGPGAVGGPAGDDSRRSAHYEQWRIATRSVFCPSMILSPSAPVIACSLFTHSVTVTTLELLSAVVRLVCLSINARRSAFCLQIGADGPSIHNLHVPPPRFFQVNAANHGLHFRFIRVNFQLSSWRVPCSRWFTGKFSACHA